jgi:hypothetical protein
VPPSVNTATGYLFPKDQGGTDGTIPTASQRPQTVNGGEVIAHLSLHALFCEIAIRFAASLFALRHRYSNGIPQLSLFAGVEPFQEFTLL